MKRPLHQLAEIAQKAVAIGNELIKSSRPGTVAEKSDRDTFTDVDVRIEQEVRTYLADCTPEMDFTGEEEGYSGRVAGSEYTWMLDPIDGTANFVHGVPLSGISLALQQRGRSIVGAISLPYLDLHYSAVVGQGAYVNGKAIKVSTASDLSKSIVAIGDYATGDGADEKNAQRISLTAALASKVERIRMFGSAAHDLAWLAEGRIDGAIILSNRALDVAAGVLIAREAGAFVLDGSGGQHTVRSGEVVAVSPGIAEEIVRITTQIVKS